MATEIIGVRRNLRRGRFRRRLRRGVPKFSGQRGWNWQEVILSNSFTNIDNVVANNDIIMEGISFQAEASPNDVGGAAQKTVVIRAMHIQLQTSIVMPQDDLYPYVAYDIALVHWIGGVPTVVPRARSIQIATSHRLFWMKRIWAAAQPGTATAGEAEHVYGVNAMPSFIDVSIRKLNLSISPQDDIGLVLSQVDSELYTDGMDALTTGYVKSFVQLK